MNSLLNPNPSQRLGASLRLLAVLCCLMLPAFSTALAGAAGADSAANRSAHPHSQPQPTAPAFGRILFLGNSMTLHGPNQSIGWSGNWGMAASAPEKDYAHIILRALAGRRGRAPEALIRNLAGFERQYAAYDPAKSLREELAFKADTVILAIGENVPKLDTDQKKSQFKASLVKLLQTLKANGHPAIFVRSCFWANPAVDGALREASRAEGATFIDIGALGKDEANYARSERPFKHAGVAAHPGDKGMQAMAEAILKAMEKPAAER